METNAGGKRLGDSPNGKGKLIAAVAGAAVVLGLAGGYIGLCASAGGEKAWPNTRILGVDVSGLTPAQAQSKVLDDLNQRWSQEPVSFLAPDGRVVETLDQVGLAEPASVADQIMAYQNKNPFLGRGVLYLGSMMGKGNNLYPPVEFTAQGREKAEAAITSVKQKLGVEGNGTTWALDGTDLVFTKGRTAAQVEDDTLLNGVKRVLAGESVKPEVQAFVKEAPPAQPDLQAIRESIYTQPADATLSRETGEIVASVTGVDLDVNAAQQALAATAEGETCRVALTLTQPELTTEAFSAMLFRDVLGEAVTKVTGTSDRVQNIGHAAKLVNNTVVFPGEEFSFNKECSPYTMQNGYGKATAYVNGLSVDTVAGGICQASSTIYWATLRANLETVERNAHRYEPSYVKGGLDATVYGDYGMSGSLDFRFRNSTNHPIRVEEYLDSSNYLHVTIRGTDETGIRGEPYSTNRVVTQAYKTVYQANSSVPQGTTRRDTERTGYTGCKIDTYLKLTDKEGILLSDKKLYTSTYRVRDEVIYFNPADLELWGIDPYTGLRTAKPSPAPEAETPAVEVPVESQAPVEVPAAPETPVESQAPVEVPAVSQAPVSYEPEPEEPALPQEALTPPTAVETPPAVVETASPVVEAAPPAEEAPAPETPAAE